MHAAAEDLQLSRGGRPVMAEVVVTFMVAGRNQKWHRSGKGLQCPHELVPSAPPLIRKVISKISRA